MLASKDYNIWTYKLGVGRQFTPHWGGAALALYEPSINKKLGPLNPTDGAVGVGLAANYTTDAGIKIGGGVEYRWLGNSEIQGPFAGAEFTDNHALGLGLTITAPF